MTDGQKKTHTQNDASFVASYDMRAVTFVLPDEMADLSIVGLHWFILIPRLNNTWSRRPNDSRSKPYLHREKTKIWNKNHQAAAILWIKRKAVVRLSF